MDKYVILKWKDGEEEPVVESEINSDELKRMISESELLKVDEMDTIVITTYRHPSGDFGVGELRFHYVPD